MSSDVVDHSVALHVLGWEPLDIRRKKAKARMMYKTLNNIGPESLTKLFHCKNETTNYGTPFQKKLDKANPYHAFKIKLLLTHSKVKPLVHSVIYKLLQSFTHFSATCK